MPYQNIGKSNEKAQPKKGQSFTPLRQKAAIVKAAVTGSSASDKKIVIDGVSSPKKNGFRGRNFAKVNNPVIIDERLTMTNLPAEKNRKTVEATISAIDKKRFENIETNTHRVDLLNMFITHGLDVSLNEVETDDDKSFVLGLIDLTDNELVEKTRSLYAQALSL